MVESKELIRYGDYITDDSFETKNGDSIRIRIIFLGGNTYYHKMKNGEVEKIIEL